MLTAKVLRASVRIKKASCNDGRYRRERDSYSQSMMCAAS